MCVSERESVCVCEREGFFMYACVYVEREGGSVCDRERERERERGSVCV